MDTSAALLVRIYERARMSEELLKRVVLLLCLLRMTELLPLLLKLRLPFSNLRDLTKDLFHLPSNLFFKNNIFFETISVLIYNLKHKINI